MTPFTLSFDDDEFDRAIRDNALMEYSPGPAPRIIIKRSGTNQGSPIAAIVFPVAVPCATSSDGMELKMAQVVTTVRLLKAVLKILEGHPWTRGVEV